MLTLPSQRHLFEVPHDIAYFNCAYNSPLLNESRDRLIEGARSKCRPWERTPASFFDDAETIRRLSSSIFGGDADGWAVVPAASYGVSTAARAIEQTLGPGDSILIIAEEFPSNVLPWRRTAKETGATLITVPVPEDGDWTRAILKRIVKGIKISALSTCHWTNGAKIDMAAISRACRDIGSTLLVDATQTLGAMPFEMDEIRPDFLVAAGYKWLLCPYGFSLLYVAEQWRQSRPLEETWLARENATDFTALVRYSDTYMPGARRFDVGEKCTATLLPGAIAALEQIRAWGVENIALTLSATNARIASHLENLELTLPIASQRCPHMFGAEVPPSLTENLVAELKKKNVYISQRGNAFRFAPHLHINDNDIQKLLNSLDDLLN